MSNLTRYILAVCVLTAAVATQSQNHLVFASSDSNVGVQVVDSTINTAVDAGATVNAYTTAAGWAGTIRFLPGTYYFSTPLDLRKGRIRVEGMSPRAIATVNNYGGVLGTRFFLKAPSNTIVRAHSATAAFIDRAFAIDIDNVSFHLDPEAPPGHSWTAISLQYTNDVYVRSCHFERAKTAIHVMGGWDTHIIGCAFDQCGSAASGAVVLENGGTGANMPTGLSLGSACATTVVRGCTWQDMPGVGIDLVNHVSGGGAWYGLNSDLSVSQCKFHGWEDSSSSPAVRGAVQGGRIEGSFFYRSGTVAPESHLVFRDDTYYSSVVITGNYFYYYTGPAILMDEVADSIVSNNQFIIDDAQDDVHKPVAHVELADGAWRTIVVGNTFYDAGLVTKPLKDAGHYTYAEISSPTVLANDAVFYTPPGTNGERAFAFSFADGQTPTIPSLRVRPNGILQFDQASTMSSPGNASVVVKWLKIGVDTGAGVQQYYLPLYQ